MDTNTVHILQSCIDDCERLIREAENDKERCNNCMGGELLKVYMQASDAAISKIKNIKNQLYNLQLEEKLKE